jgi:hypothetical protein
VGRASVGLELRERSSLWQALDQRAQAATAGGGTVAVAASALGAWSACTPLVVLEPLVHVGFIDPDRVALHIDEHAHVELGEDVCRLGEPDHCLVRLARELLGSFELLDSLGAGAS